MQFTSMTIFLGSIDKKLLSRLADWSSFLLIFVSTTAIIYSKQFSLALRKFVLLMWLLDDAIRNMKSFLKTLGKLLLGFGKLFFVNCIGNCSICEFWCFDLRAFYKEMTYEFMQNICLYALLFANRSSRWQMFFKISTSQYSQENPCIGVGSLILITLQARRLLLSGVKFTLKNVYADAD